MAQEALLALDVGTSGCRAEVLGLDGGCLGRHYREYEVATPAVGAAEQDPEQWWNAVVTCTREARAQAGDGVCLRAVGLSVQGHTWVPVDSEGRALHPALTWLDARAAAQAQRLLEDRGAEFWGRSAGKLPGPWHLLSQLQWLRETEPETVAAADRFLFCHDWLVARLTGAPATDHTHAATSLLYDLTAADWSDALLADYGLRAEQFAPLGGAGGVAGRLTAEAAAALGLDAGAVVAVGAQDQKCAALAAGLDETTATVSLGTAVAIEALVGQPRFDPDRGAIPCFPWLRPGEYVLEAPLTTGGGALRWLRDALTEGAGTDFAGLIAAAEAVPPGAEGVTFLPYLAGAGAPYWRSEATATFSGLTLRSGRGHLVRAVLEGVAADIRANLDCMRDLGCRIERLRLFGGGVRSELWPRIIAGVCDLPVETTTEAEAATRGAAMLAAEALSADPEVFALPAMPLLADPDWREAYARLGPVHDACRRRNWE